MSYDELENAWRSPRNMPETGALTAARERLFADLARRRRGKRVFLAVVLGALTLITTRVAFAVWSRGGTPVMNAADDWAAWLFLAIPWAGFFLLLRRSVRPERVNPASVQSGGEAVRALLDENKAARAGLKVVAGLIGATLVLLPVVVWRLRATGKAGDEILGPAFVGWPLVAGAILAALWWHERSQLRPRRRQLEALGREYERLD
jgi:hypothetical protein